MGRNSGGVRGGHEGGNSASEKAPNVSAKDIYTRLGGLNAQASGYGSKFTNWNEAREKANENREELKQYLPEGSLARKILDDNKTITEKQQWVIAYELQKNPEFTKKMAARLESDRQYAERERQQRASKSAAKKERKATRENFAKAPKVEAKVGNKVMDITGRTGTIVGSDGDMISVRFENGVRKIHKRALNVR